MRHGLSLIVVFGLVGWRSSAGRRHLRLALGILSITVLAYNFDDRYEATLEAFERACAIAKFQPKLLMDSIYKLRRERRAAARTQK